MIKVSNVNKVYITKNKSRDRREVVALNDVSCAFEDKGMYFILGPSGSGKTTFLNLIAGIDNVNSGSIVVDGDDLSKKSQSQLDYYRNTHIGMVYQDFNLLEDLTVEQNIEIALQMQHYDKESSVKAVQHALSLVGLEDYQTRYVNELSGGQKQRIAIARAIVKRPKVILADEPTGNLDVDNSVSIMKLLRDISRDVLVIIVSHDRDGAVRYGDQIIELHDAKLVKDYSNATVDSDVLKQSVQNIYDSTSSTRQIKLGFKTSVTTKYGIKLALAKPIRLIFSVLLPGIVLGVFGLTLAIALFDSISSQLAFTRSNGYNYAWVSKQYSDSNNSISFTQQELSDIHKSYQVWDMSNRTFILDTNINANYPDNMDGNRYNQLTLISDTKNYYDLGLEPIGNSRMPAAVGEIAITDVAYEYMLKYGYRMYLPDNSEEEEYVIEASDITLETVLSSVKLEYMSSDGYAYATVVGVFKTQFDVKEYYISDPDDTFSSDELAISQMRIISREFHESLNDSIQAVMIKTTSNYRSLIGEHSIEGTNYIYKLHTRYTFWFEYNTGNFENFSTIVIYMALGLGIFASLLITNFIIVSIGSSVRRIGILRALGASSKDVIKILLSESGFVALCVFVVSLAFSFLACYVANDVFFASYGSRYYLIQPSVASSVILLAVCIVITALFTIIPIWKLSKSRPIEIIKKVV